jgi:hypothetical protein
MSIVLKPGTRLFGAADTTEVVVVRAPAEAVDLRIGGHPALTDAKSRTEGLEVTTPSEAAPSIGKRYVDSSGSLELLCTKAGQGALAVGDDLCVVKDAKPLPASD